MPLGVANAARRRPRRSVADPESTRARIPPPAGAAWSIAAAAGSATTLPQDGELVAEEPPGQQDREPEGRRTSRGRDESDQHRRQGVLQPRRQRPADDRDPG